MSTPDKWDDASDEPLSIIESNECGTYVGTLSTKRFRRAFNEIHRLQSSSSNTNGLEQSLRELIAAVREHVVTRTGSEDAIWNAVTKAEASIATSAERDMVLDKPAQIGATRFGPGVKWSTVIDRAQREWDYYHGLKNPHSSPIDGEHASAIRPISEGHSPGGGSSIFDERKRDG